VQVRSACGQPGKWSIVGAWMPAEEVQVFAGCQPGKWCVGAGVRRYVSASRHAGASTGGAACRGEVQGLPLCQPGRCRTALRREVAGKMERRPCRCAASRWRDAVEGRWCRGGTRERGVAVEGRWRGTCRGSTEASVVASAEGVARGGGASGRHWGVARVEGAKRR